VAFLTEITTKDTMNSKEGPDGAAFVPIVPFVVIPWF
jgi:hypothetical protein